MASSATVHRHVVPRSPACDFDRPVDCLVLLALCSFSSYMLHDWAIVVNDGDELLGEGHIWRFMNGLRKYKRLFSPSSAGDREDRPATNGRGDMCML